MLWILSQQLLYANKTLDFVCFGQFLGPFLLKALKFQVLVKDSVHRRRDTGFPSDLTYALMSSRRIFLADNEQFNVANVVSCAGCTFSVAAGLPVCRPCIASICRRSRSSAERDQSLSGNSSNNLLAL